MEGSILNKDINNPVIPGMAPDPSIIRVGDTYYIATSTFHWKPGIQLYQSNDLVNWQLIDFVLKDDVVDLRGSNTPTGVWAPHLSYDESSNKYWIVYSQMVNMAGREFNANNFAIWAYDIKGPWSEPLYITSIGFDPALFHDENGKHYIAILEWEIRTGYQAPGHIVIAEVDIETGKLLSDWNRVTQGFTSRGNAEAPGLYKRNGYYYLVIAAGGTGYGHGVEIGRSKNIFGPYEPHPSLEPIITSAPQHLFSLGDPDAGHFEMYNPDSVMQKSGHGSLVETPSGEWYMAHLMSRPLKGELLNPLGRETSIQKMVWTKDDWLEMEDGTNLAKMTFKAPKDFDGVQIENPKLEDNFEGDYRIDFMTPYHAQSPDWVNTTERKGFLRVYGRDSLFSQREPSIMATKATSFEYEVSTKLAFAPDHYSETAGLGLYYDSNNWLYLNLTYNEQLNSKVLTILQANQGVRKEYIHNRVPMSDLETELKLKYNHGYLDIFYRKSEKLEWNKLLEKLDVRYLSDEGVNGEPGEIGGFTGLFNFIGSVDSHQHDSYADFAFYRVINN